VYILDELRDAQRTSEVPQRDGVAGEAGEVVEKRDDGEEILFDGEVKGVAVFEVDGDFGWVIS
jgi:hypothetical protein